MGKTNLVKCFFRKVINTQMVFLNRHQQSDLSTKSIKKRLLTVVDKNQKNVHFEAFEFEFVC